MTTKSKSKPATPANPDAEMEAQRRSVVPLQWQRVYAKHEDKALRGTCADEFAVKFRKLTTGKDGKLDIGALVRIGQANGIDPLTRWAGKNPGMLRMNLGNVLRGMAKRGEKINWK